MKALALTLVAVVLSYAVLHRKPLQRTSEQAKAWAGWFDAHPNGGGI